MTDVAIDVAEVEKRLAGQCLVQGVNGTERGYVRIETAFLYPEGSNVDLFVRRDGELLLSDLGTTMGWLLDIQIRPWLSKKRQAFIEDALRIHGVQQREGRLEIVLPSLDDLVAGIVRLGQACVRVADLIYTRRSSLQSPAAEEVEEIFADSGLRYETDPEIEGRFGARVRVDFLVHGRRKSTAVLTWSSANRTQAHIQANEIFRRWYDLDTPARSEQRLTIFDDRYDTYREDDLKRLRDKSDVVALSDRDAILELVAA